MQAESSLLCIASLIASCAGAGSVREPPSPTTTATPAPISPAPIVQGSDWGAVSASKPREEPAPLSAGSDGGLLTPPVESRPNACTPDTIRRTLEEVVARCKGEGQRVCGELKVRASNDGKSIHVALDIAKDSFDDSFSRCITSRLNGVAWRCTLPGSDTTLDLGCDL